jgi:hypothetical protein
MLLRFHLRVVSCVLFITQKMNLFFIAARKGVENMKKRKISALHHRKILCFFFVVQKQFEPFHETLIKLTTI